jgi:hydrogenase-4 component B
VSGLFAAALILLAVAAAADLAGWQGGPPYVFGAAGSACLAVTGGFALAGRTVRLPVAGWLGQPVPGQPSAALSADRLSGLFLVMAFGAAALVSVAFASWAARPDTPVRRGLGASYALALGSVAVVVTARDAFTALFGWEALTIAFYLLAGSSRRRSQAAQVTFGFGKLSGAALLAGLLLLAARSHSIMLASFAHVPGGAARTTALVLGSRSRPAWCRSRSGCRPATPRPLARPARSWPGCASTSPSTACGARWRCSAARRGGWSACCS